MSEEDLVVPSNKDKNRDELGRWIPGCKAPNPTPTGRPKGKRQIIDKLAKLMYGEEFEQLFLSMIEIAQYERGPKERFPKWSNKDVLDARKFLFDHVFDKAMTRVDATIEQKTINVNIDLPTNVSEEDF